MSESQDLITSLSPDSLTQILQKSGYRAEVFSDGGETVLRSGTGGMSFNVRFADPAPDKADHHHGVTFFVAMKVEGGSLPLALLNRWNNEKRFGRLHLDRGFLVLDMNVILLGGIAAAHLIAQIQVWDRMLQEFLAWLRVQPIEQPAPMLSAVPKASESEADSNKAVA